jgi:hypothetical protein
MLNSDVDRRPAVPLIKCPDCSKEVSDTADKCLNCGYRLPKKEYLFWRGLMALILVGLGLYVASEGWAVPGGGAVWFGLFMIVFGGVVFVAMVWKAATS